MNDRPDPREPWDEVPDRPHGLCEAPDVPPMPWDERPPPRRGFGMPGRPPGAGREWETATDLLRNQLTRVLFGVKQPRAKNPDAESRRPLPDQVD
jgi:hypothetical protein